MRGLESVVCIFEVEHVILVDRSHDNKKALKPASPQGLMV